MHTTNYHNTFIEVAEDCPVKSAEIPPQKGAAKTTANIQYELLAGHPYQYTSDDVIFGAFAQKAGLPAKILPAERERYFSKGQACFRCSPLTKRYGWGVHSNAEEKIAIYAVESDDYKKLAADGSLKHVKAMRSKRA